MGKLSFKLILASYKNFRRLPSSGDVKRDLRNMEKHQRRVRDAAKREGIQLTKEHYL